MTRIPFEKKIRNKRKRSNDKVCMSKRSYKSFKVVASGKENWGTGKED